MQQEKGNQEETQEIETYYPIPIEPDEELIRELDTVDQEIVYTADVIVKLNPRQTGFLVQYDGDDWELHSELPMMMLLSAEVYWGRFAKDGFEKHPLSDPPPKKEQGWLKYCSLTFYHQKYGEVVLRLPPTGYSEFKAFRQKWQRQGIDVFQKFLKIRSRINKTKSGYLLNVPKFSIDWTAVSQMRGQSQQIAEESNENFEGSEEQPDDVPF